MPSDWGSNPNLGLQETQRLRLSSGVKGVDVLSGSQGKKMTAGVETHLGRFFLGIGGAGLSHPPGVKGVSKKISDLNTGRKLAAGR
jgi:hypothetical protein